MPDSQDSAAYQDLELVRITVKYSKAGEPLDITCSFAESGGMCWFDINGDHADYDSHVHSVDREKAKEAVSNLPFIEEVHL